MYRLILFLIVGKLLVKLTNDTRHYECKDPILAITTAQDSTKEVKTRQTLYGKRTEQLLIDLRLCNQHNKESHSSAYIN